MGYIWTALGQILGKFNGQKVSLIILVLDYREDLIVVLSETSNIIFFVIFLLKV